MVLPSLIYRWTVLCMNISSHQSIST